ncbi:uncharacterized protein LOC121926725 [Sceloporus undulatus]|uniref:uncharacterized protein LOC121926725 n=1 Tax=Sceloporus undulatus TaxID=8520 RepID=UPI001C4BB3AF|nr:uncharacterized protein LOC121926725 [Sceloporus undulatus]
MASGTRKATAQTSLQANRRPSLETIPKLTKTTEMAEQNESLIEEMRRLNAITNAEIYKSAEDMKREFRTELGEIRACLDRLEEDINKTKGKVKDLEDKSSKMTKKIEMIEKEQIDDQEQILRLQLKQRENCLKLRGLPEKTNENLYVELSSILAKFVDEPEAQFPWELDRVYRLNSYIAKTRKLPRDVVVYFVRKQTRDLVLQQSFKSKLIIENKEIMILKDIPGKILRRRKDYNFLVDKLKNYDIPFKWEEIEGLQVSWKQKKFKVNSILKAKELLNDIQEDLKKQGQGGGESTKEG